MLRAFFYFERASRYKVVRLPLGLERRAELSGRPAVFAITGDGALLVVDDARIAREYFMGCWTWTPLAARRESS